MAVASKRRRKLMYLDQLYFWYVKGDYDFCDRPVLHIISSDKKLILAYPLHAQTPYVVSKGMLFQKYPATGSWKRYLSPVTLPHLHKCRSGGFLLDKTNVLSLDRLTPFVQRFVNTQFLFMQTMINIQNPEY